jgi:hypothetical protein
MVDRTPRTEETRDKTARKRTWERPSALPTPEPRDGIMFRWIRTSTLGDTDNRNVSMRFREGYTPVKASDYPELRVISDRNSQFPDNIEIGGLLLCSIPAEIVEDRSAQMAEKARQQMESVDRNYLRENDPRMPMLRPERESRTTNFGK